MYGFEIITYLSTLTSVRWDIECCFIDISGMGVLDLGDGFLCKSSHTRIEMVK